MNEFDKYKPNSNKYKAEQKEAEKIEEKRVAKVVTGPVKTKKNEIRRISDIFVPGDVNNVKSYIFMDVLVPAIKKAVSDIVTNGIDMILYGETRSHKPGSSSAYISYDRFSDPRDGQRRFNPVQRASGLNYDDVIFQSRGEADMVLSQMESVIDRYGFVTVSDLFDMADLTAPYTGNKYGWMNVRNGEVVRVRDGYVIKLPRAVPLD